MTRLLAHEWAPHVRVNAIAVGATKTDALAMVTADEALAKQLASRGLEIASESGWESRAMQFHELCQRLVAERS